MDTGFEPAECPAPIDVLTPRLGPCFCYRILMDPAMLAGYSLNLWGQYPALLDGPPGAVVVGMVYGVEYGRLIPVHVKGRRH